MNEEGFTSEFSTKILGVEDPWKVHGVRVIKAPKEVVVILDISAGTVWKDEKRGGRGQVHGSSPRDWLHLDTYGYVTTIKASVPRLK